MWTANEEALTVDGPVVDAVGRHRSCGCSSSTSPATRSTAGPAVRLPRRADSRHEHAGQPAERTCRTWRRCPTARCWRWSDRSPWRRRSISTASTRSNFAGATDVSVGAFGSGPDRADLHARRQRRSLWSGAADGASGQNMEGLALGPRLANGKLGAARRRRRRQRRRPIERQHGRRLHRHGQRHSADFDADGDVDGADFLRLAARARARRSAPSSPKATATATATSTPPIWPSGKATSPSPRVRGACPSRRRARDWRTRRRRIAGQRASLES